MVNFIICEDNKDDQQVLLKFIRNFMFRNDLEYDKYVFDDYNQEFIKMVSMKLPGKIYFLDIETPTLSGIDVTRIIRNRDVDSVIIFITGHDENKEEMVQDEFLYLSFINKFENYEQRLSSALTTALSMIKVKQSLRIKTPQDDINLAYNDILFITRDTQERKTVIVTDNSKHLVGLSLKEIESMLTDSFIKTHRSCIVNKVRVVKYNKASRKIEFDNGKIIDMVSRDFRGDIIC